MKHAQTLLHNKRSREYSYQRQNIDRLHVYRRRHLLHMADYVTQLSASEFLELLTTDSAWETMLTLWAHSLHWSAKCTIPWWGITIQRYFRRNLQNTRCLMAKIKNSTSQCIRKRREVQLPDKTYIQEITNGSSETQGRTLAHSSCQVCYDPLRSESDAPSA